jgi:hypothetical protein
MRFAARKLEVDYDPITNPSPQLAGVSEASLRQAGGAISPCSATGESTRLASGSRSEGVSQGQKAGSAALVQQQPAEVRMDFGPLSPAAIAASDAARAAKAAAVVQPGGPSTRAEASSLWEPVPAGIKLADRSVQIPVALVPAAPAIPLTEPQVTQWEQLESDFVAALGGPNQDPQDPEYRARWDAAQRLNDDIFRAKFGTEAFVLQQMERQRQQHE